MIYWREILNAARIEWHERGANVSRGNINISCPWCGIKDPSYHLAIDENTGEYYCYRNPRHKGRNPFWLLVKLKIKNIEKLLKDYSTNEPVRKSANQNTYRRSLVKKSSIISAAESEIAKEYLEFRGFPYPEEVVKNYNLGIDPHGKLAHRLLFPLDENEDAYVGRAFYDDMEPRYLSTAIESCLYVPRNFEGGVLLFLEGPVDVLKCDYSLIVGYGQGSGMAVGLLGFALTENKFDQIEQLASKADDIFLILDDDQVRSKGHFLAKNIEILTRKSVSLMYGPKGHKDIGSASIEEIIYWLRPIASTMQKILH